MSATVHDTAERAAALAAVAEGLVRAMRLWCAEQDSEPDVALIESLAYCRLGPEALRMLGERGFDVRQRRPFKGVA